MLALCAGFPSPQHRRPKVRRLCQETFGRPRRRGRETRAERVEKWRPSSENPPGRWTRWRHAMLEWTAKRAWIRGPGE